MPLLSAGLTDVGQTRRTNQDSIYLDPQERIFVVADGMGGHNGGDIASNLATQAISSFLGQHNIHASSTPSKVIHASVVHANVIIQEEGLTNPKLAGMGTTITAAVFVNGDLHIANVGDSRIYLINKSHIYQITSDHSLIQEKIKIGLLTRQEALLDPEKNVLIRAVGFEKKINVDVYSYKVLKHDLFLLCSDGLHGKVSEEDMLKIICSCIPSPEEASLEDLEKAIHALIALANLNGGQDNISAILILTR